MTNADSKYIGYASEAMAKKQIRPTTIKELDIERKERIKPFDDACINARNNIYKLAGVKSIDIELKKRFKVEKKNVIIEVNGDERD